MMVKLRHLYTKLGVFTFHHPSEETEGNDFDRSSTLDSLQNLHKMCACEACQRVLVRSPNLRKLGLHADYSWRDAFLCFPNLACFKCLEKLTFSINRPPLPSELTLQPGLKLPQTITRITLKGTNLKWEELSLLQTLPSLEVLRLIRRACLGRVWNTSELEGFPQLKYLRFYELNIQEWITSEDQFPKLEVLVIEHCSSLKRIPIAFGNLNELREIKLQSCRKEAEKSAREIQKEQRNRKGDDDCVNLLFKFNNYFG
ncbi:hypothetical protein Vadar_025306 [Vaccinium darrowii]|uniref:Uncharacterized protein n=1 Tax=Vaccinium darrowii TaxID=229202 RepID=A0ACB7Y1N6_9ERIC|nr:hypothetical protein Vadar_025306 [Vaccinium darrowii]